MSVGAGYVMHAGHHPSLQCGLRVHHPDAFVTELPVPLEVGEVTMKLRGEAQPHNPGLAVPVATIGCTATGSQRVAALPEVLPAI